MAFVEQLDNGWFVQVAAIWHYYLSLCFNIIMLNFLLLLSIPFIRFWFLWYQ